MRPDEQKVLWSILDARDETVRRMSAQLFAKEQVIQELKTAYENMQSQIDQIESVMQQQGNELLSHKKLPGFNEAEALLVERDKTIQALSDSFLFSAVNGSAHTNLALVKSLEEKELVIQELAQAVKHYRVAIGVFSYLLRPANRMKTAIAGIKNRLGVMVAPRLGNLNQHAPRPVCLPRHYEQAITLSDTPRVSIITPSFMQARFIGRTIESVLGQSYPNLEYFVQDGGSQDGTVEVLEEYANRLAGWESQSDGGQSQAINLGFAHTTGEIMAWLNSDDMLLPGAIHTIVDYFNRHPEVDVVYGDRLLVDERDMEIGRWIMPGHDSEVLSWADYVPQETLFWRRRIWDRVGGQIDESFKFAMDWDLLVRFRDAGARFAHIPRFLGAFRIHEHQKTSAAINEIGHKEMDRIREKLLGRVPGHMEVRKAVIPFLLKHVSTHMAYRVKSRLWGKQ
ncbi:MAG: glycosyltransferase family 2 protein [Sulfurimicrobium sp.]|nr:glycosyltransferase family 2 protein [Sulfurimicrobium sp.]